MHFLGRNLALFWLVVPTALLALTSCALTRQAPKVERSGFLAADGERLQPQDRPFTPALGFVDAEADWRSYDKIYIYPVTLWGASEETFGSNAHDRQRLVENFHGLLQSELSKDYEIVSDPELRTMVMRVAITEVDTSTPVLDPVTAIIPQTRLLTTAGGYVTGKPAFTGGIQIEFKVNDFANGSLLAAGIDKRVGEKRVLTSFDSWSDIDDAMDFWAQQARYRLCRRRGDANCVEPESKRTL